MRARRERFSGLFAATYGPLWAYARRRVPADAVDDVVAEVLTVAWRRLDVVPDGDDALPWLYGVAHRTIANHRRAERRRLRLVERLRAEPVRPAVEPDGSVTEVFATLAPREQEVLRLAAWEDLGAAQIAVVLGCSPNAAAIRLSRARAALREALKGSGLDRTYPGREEIDV